MCALVTIVCSLPPALLGAAIVAAAFMRVVRRYRPAAAEAKRLVAVLHGPVVAHVLEGVGGREYLRAFRQESGYVAHMLVLVEASSRAQLFNVHFGSVFRTQNDATAFAFAVKQYVDVYTAHIDHLLQTTGCHRFYPTRRGLLPHEFRTSSDPASSSYGRRADASVRRWQFAPVLTSGSPEGSLRWRLRTAARRRRAAAAGVSRPPPRGTPPPQQTQPSACDEHDTP